MPGRYVSFGDNASDLRAEIVAMRVKMRTERDPEQRRVLVTSMLNKIASLMAQYKAQADEALYQRWRDEYTRLSAGMAQVRQAVSAGESPAYIMSMLDGIGDRILKLADTVVTTAGKVIEGAGDIATGLGSTAKALPILLPLALVAAAFVIGSGGLGGLMRRSNPRRRRNRHRRRRVTL